MNNEMTFQSCFEVWDEKIGYVVVRLETSVKITVCRLHKTQKSFKPVNFRSDSLSQVEKSQRFWQGKRRGYIVVFIFHGFSDIIKNNGESVFFAAAEGVSDVGEYIYGSAFS